MPWPSANDRNDRGEQGMSYFHEISADRESASLDQREQLAQARRLFETFAGFAAPQVATRRINRTIPKVLVDMGALRGLPPRLMCDADGRQLYVLGGSYRVTYRGLEG